MGGCSSSRPGQRELLARCAVPRGSPEESPASPTHQGFEVALRVRWRSFMNELSRALGMNPRHEQAVLFSKLGFVLGSCGPLCGGGCSVILMQCMNVASPLQ